MDWLSNWPIADPRVPITRPQTSGRKVPLPRSANCWRLTKMSIEHILGCISWLWSDAINNRTAFVKAPNEWTQIEINMCGRRACWITIVTKLSVGKFLHTGRQLKSCAIALEFQYKNLYIKLSESAEMQKQTGQNARHLMKPKKTQKISMAAVHVYENNEYNHFEIVH